jgi:HAE1 family hydrophobic/amphiphilic exporter-1
LPEEVQRQGVLVKKASTSIVKVISLYAPEGAYDDLFLANYITLYIKDELLRIDGVGDVSVFPPKDYGMRIWLNPNQMEYRRLTTNDVVEALRRQNVQVPAGQIGQPPAKKGQEFQLTVNTLGRLSEPEQFGDIIVKTGEDGRITQVKDVAKVELGGNDYSMFSTLNGSPSATLLVFQTPGSNALQVADLVAAKMKELSERFPHGLKYKTVHDYSEFVMASIKEVIETLLIAFILVFIVVFVFLQDWRATLIPVVAIPVSLIGTFSVMLALGFSINMITLFGLVLAIGIVVDDAIVVVENVDRNMAEFDLGPKDAAIRAMGEITGPIISTTLVLLAVFAPAAFLGGITGQLYRQFSLTIAVSTLFSSINALTLSPALCAIFLRHKQGPPNVFFRGFNTVFNSIRDRYSRLAQASARRGLVTLLLFAGLVALTYFAVIKVPTGFVPKEDDGLIVMNVQLPDAASLQRTRGVVKQINSILEKTPGVADYVMLGGYSVLDGAASNFAAGFAALAPWEERYEKGLFRQAIIGDLAGKFYGIQEAIIMPFTFPPIPGVGSGSGFELQIRDKEDLGLQELAKTVHSLARKANATPELTEVFATYKADTPIIWADVDRVKALKMKVPLQGVFDTMQSYLGSTYVNDFNKFGRIWQVKVQAQSKFRSDPKDIARLEVRNQEGKMVPLGALAKIEDSTGPPRVDRYNLFPTARISGSPAPGVSSGQALETMEDIAEQNLPGGMDYQWTGMSYQEKKAAGSGTLMFALAILVVILILAALYESWIDPFSVVLAAPLAVLGAMIAVMIRGMDNNVYTQIGLVLLVALSAKNAILIVEFAREKRAEGMDAIQAATQGAKLRFRPILMTSFAFIVGVAPLVWATGAGAVSRQALGTAVFGGMIGVTTLGLIFIPNLYVAIQRLRR